MPQDPTDPNTAISSTDLYKQICLTQTDTSSSKAFQDLPGKVLN